MDIRIVSDIITKQELAEIAEEFYGNMIKGVVDVENEILAFGGEYHIDANEVLMGHGLSQQQHIWGFNVYLDKDKENRLEYMSLINIRPAAGNRDMLIESEELKTRIKSIIDKKIYD